MQKVFQTERAFSLGLSATPERDHDPPEDDETEEPVQRSTRACSGQELGPVIFELNYAEAIRLGVLPPFNIVHYGLSLKPPESAQYEKISREIKNLRKELERPGAKGWRSSAGAARKPPRAMPRPAGLIALTAERKRLLFRMEERANAVARILREAFAENPETKAILFHESIDEVMRLFALLRARGLRRGGGAQRVSGEMRATSLRLFRSGAAQVIVSARSLIEGFNVPSADLGIIVAATSSVRQRVQTLGRLLRKSKRGRWIGKASRPARPLRQPDGRRVDLRKGRLGTLRRRGAEPILPLARRGATAPQPAAKAPRSPAPDETAVDEAALRPRETYPGNIDQGLAFTRDTQGTIRTEDGVFIEPHPELVAVLKQLAQGRRPFPRHARPPVCPRAGQDREPAGAASTWAGSALRSPWSSIPRRSWPSATGNRATPIRSPAPSEKPSPSSSATRACSRLKTRGTVRFVPPLPRWPIRKSAQTLSRIQSLPPNRLHERPQGQQSDGHERGPRRLYLGKPGLLRRPCAGGRGGFRLRSLSEYDKSAGSRQHGNPRTGPALTARRSRIRS